jgi:competence protein ComEC
MKSWNAYPLVRVFIPFASGIVAAILMDKNIHFPLWLFILLLLLCGLYAFYLVRYISYRNRWIYGPVIFLFLFLCGFELTVQRTEKFNPDHFINLSDTGRYCLVRIIEPPQVRERSMRAEAEFIGAGDTSRWKTCIGKVMVYFQKDSTTGNLKYGDVLLIDAWPERVKPPQNPGEFDYRNYLAMRSVYHQVYVPSENIISYTKGYTNPVYRIAYSLRDRILSIFQSNHLTGKEYAVTSALLIGYTEKLDADLMEDYSGTGAMHILSVSGLHVGIIFVLLNMLLFFLDKKKWGQVIKTIILLLFIWAYAILTGLSPSVLRASAMFSLVVLGRQLSRDTGIYNNIAASLIVLLMVNPYYIADIGFQLSYLAVIGIVSLHPYISSWWKPRWWIFRQIWSITSVSIAAQLATFPVSLYYFHQFPNYFLVTNLIAIPLSGFVMYAGMATLALSFIPAISGIVARGLIWLVYALNSSIAIIEDLPGAVTRGLYIDLPETIILYALIILLIFFFLSKKKWSLFIAASFAVILLSSFLVRNLTQVQQQKMIVYSIRKGSACDLICGKNRLLLADSLLLADNRRQDFYMKESAEQMGIKHVQKVRYDKEDFEYPGMGVYKKGRFVQFREKRIAFVRQREANLKKIKVDFLIISGNPKLKIREVLENYDTGMIIIDSSNPNYKVAGWIKECNALKLPCYSVPDAGALVVEL